MPPEPSSCPSCGVTVEADKVCLACLFDEALQAEDSHSATGESSFGDYASPAAGVFGKYILRRKLGEGGMGIIWEAEDTTLGRMVALKMIRGFAFSRDSERQRFHAEANAVAQLDHANIVPIYEVGEIDDQPYFSMKLLKGGTLSQGLQGGAMEPRGSAAIMEKLARAIHHAHERGVLHRDLKPDNVVFDEEGEPYLTDFGLAKLLDSSDGLTRTHAHVGTPQYMSPEQARGRASDITAASDVWAAGALFYHMLTGRLPFPGETSGEIFDQVANAGPASMRTGTTSVDKDLEVLCQRCLEKDPAERPASADELADELGRWLKGEPIHMRPATRFERTRRWARRHPWRVVSAALFVLLVAGAAAGLFQAPRSSDSSSASQPAAGHPAKTGNLNGLPLVPPLPTYEVGDSFPGGGIIASIDKTRMVGFVVDAEDSGPFDLEGARAAVEARGGGWRLPSLDDLKVVQENLGIKKDLNFKEDVFYLSGEFSSASTAYWWGLNLTTGKESGGLHHKDSQLVRFVRDFALPTRYRILAHPGPESYSYPHTLSVGDTHPWGGTVAWVDFSGKRGLVVDTEDSGRFSYEEAIAAAEARGAMWALPTLDDLKIVHQNLGSSSDLSFVKGESYLTSERGSQRYMKGLILTTGAENGLGLPDRHLVRFVRTFDPESLHGIKRFLAYESSERHPRAGDGAYSVQLIPEWDIGKGYVALEVFEVPLDAEHSAFRVANYQPPDGYQPDGQIIPWLAVDEDHGVMILPRPAGESDPGQPSRLVKRAHPNTNWVILGHKSDQQPIKQLFNKDGGLSVDVPPDRDSMLYNMWRMWPAPAAVEAAPPRDPEKPSTEKAKAEPASGIVITFSDDGTNTTATYSGGLDVSSLGEPTPHFQPTAYLAPSHGRFAQGGKVDRWELGAGAFSPTGGFGTSGGADRPPATNTGTDPFHFFAAGGRLEMPANYESNTPIKGAVFYKGATVADLGISDTIYTFGGGQTITIQVADPAPNPPGSDQQPTPKLDATVQEIAPGANVAIVFLEGDHRLYQSGDHGVEVHVRVKTEGTAIMENAEIVEFDFLQRNQLLEPKSTRGWFGDPQGLKSDFRAIHFEPGVTRETTIWVVRSEAKSCWTGEFVIQTGDDHDQPFFRATDNLIPYGNSGKYVEVSTDDHEAQFGIAHGSIYLSDRGWLELCWTGEKARLGDFHTTYFLPAGKSLQALGLRPGTSVSWEDDVYGKVVLVIQPGAPD